MRKIETLIAVFIILLGQVKASDIMIWDKSQQVKLGYGTFNQNNLELNLIKDARGPVIILFSISNSDKKKFSNLKARYEGEIKDKNINIRNKNDIVELSKFLEIYKVKLKIEDFEGQSGDR